MNGIAVCPTMAGAPAAAPAGETGVRRGFDPTPDLQLAPGGGLVVNAFIMDGPVRVEIRDRANGRVVMSKEADTMFPFEVSRHDLTVEATEVVVRIYVKGKLAYELNLVPEG